MRDVMKAGMAEMLMEARMIAGKVVCRADWYASMTVSPFEVIGIAGV